MSWTKRSQEILYRDFTEKAACESQSMIEKAWSLEIWDISEDGQLREYAQNTVRRLNGRPQLRIVFSRRSDENNAFSCWFRFSYVSAASAATDDESPDGEDDTTENSAIADKYAERASAFFLQASTDTSVTLILFDVALEGLHEEVDYTARRIEEEFEPLEKPGIATTIRSSHTGSSFDEAHRGFDSDILTHNHRCNHRRIGAIAIGTIRRRRLMGCQRNTIILSVMVHFGTVDPRVGSLVTLLALVDARQERQDDTAIFMDSEGDDMEEIHEREEGAR
ncbi:hypothetical protein THAR02_05401 [Trichoderma harzianum]|uniref:Uncharacterized protein n=1 Tax=Trichoderma harzianum TaxID=5544 RepID=A0A0F9ZQB8_TRIHA|nr:hypothetical protein THAR02_05401 [Trichoderma harzianum]